MTLERKISWLSPSQRKTATSCNDLGTFFHDNLDDFQKKINGIKDEKITSKAPSVVIAKFDESIARIEQKRRDAVRSIWRDPVTRKSWGRNDDDIYYFMRAVPPATEKEAAIHSVFSFGNEWMEIDKEKHDSISEALHAEWWEFLRCKFDSKNVTFLDA